MTNNENKEVSNTGKEKSKGKWVALAVFGLIVAFAIFIDKTNQDFIVGNRNSDDSGHGSGKEERKQEKEDSRYLYAVRYIDGFGIIEDEDNKWKCITEHGEEVFTSDYGEIIGFDKELYVIKNDEGLYGFVDKDNVIRVPFVIESQPVKISDEGYWVNGACLISDGQTSSLIDASGQIIPKPLEYESILGQYNLDVYLRDKDGRICVVGNGGYSSCPLKEKLHWDYYSEIWLIRRNGGGVGYAVKKATSSAGEGSYYNVYQMFEPDSTNYSSLKEIADKYNLASATRTYPGKYDDKTMYVEEKSSYSCFEDNGKYGLKRYEDRIIVDAISFSPIRMYEDKSYGKSYCIIDGEINGKRTQYLINELGDRYFPPEFNYKTLPSKCGLALIEYTDCASDMYTKEIRKCIINVRTGIVIKKLKGGSGANEQFVGFAEDGKAILSDGYKSDYDKTYNYQYLIDANGVEYHDKEAEKAAFDSRQADNKMYQEQFKKRESVSSQDSPISEKEMTKAVNDMIREEYNATNRRIMQINRELESVYEPYSRQALIAERDALIQKLSKLQVLLIM